MNETKVFLNSWYFYNEGSIGFGWMTPEEARDFMKDHEDDSRYDEWFIADLDNYLGLEYDNLNYMDVETVLSDIELLEGLEDYEIEEVKAVAEYRCCDYEEAYNKLDHYVIYSDVENYLDCMDELLEDQINGCPEVITRYFDYDAYHNDCMYDATELSNGVVIVE